MHFSFTYRAIEAQTWKANQITRSVKQPGLGNLESAANAEFGFYFP